MSPELGDELDNAVGAEIVDDEAQRQVLLTQIASALGNLYKTVYKAESDLAKAAEIAGRKLAFSGYPDANVENASISRDYL